MEEQKNTQYSQPDGLINPKNVIQKPINLKQVKEVKYLEDGLMERSETKVVINDGRELL
jgi:hypothetical protein